MKSLMTDLEKIELALRRTVSGGAPTLIATWFLNLADQIALDETRRRAERDKT